MLREELREELREDLREDFTEKFGDKAFGNYGLTRLNSDELWEAIDICRRINKKYQIMNLNNSIRNWTLIIYK